MELTKAEARTIKEGDVLIHINTPEVKDEDPRARYFLVLSVTLTHTYLKNAATGERFNKPNSEVMKEMVVMNFGIDTDGE